MKHAHYTKTEQVVWIIIAFALMITEIRVIKESDEDAESQKRIFEQSLQSQFSKTESQFNETVLGLETVINQSNAQYKGTIGKINEVISTETGGDTFCYLAFDDWITWENGKPQPQKGFSLDLEKVGKYPLRDLNLIVDDHVKYGLTMNRFIQQRIQNHTAPSNEQISTDMDQARKASEITIQIGDLGIERKWLGVYPANGQDREEFDVLFRAFNSSGWIERVSLSHVSGKWKRAVLVELYDQRREKWTKIDKDYPRKDGHLDVNWPRPVRGRAKWDH